MVMDVLDQALGNKLEVDSGDSGRSYSHCKCQCAGFVRSYIETIEMNRCRVNQNQQRSLKQWVES